MARAKAPESQKKTGDVMESLIERSEADERRNAPSNDDESTLERDPDDDGPEDEDEDPEDSDSDDE